MKKAVIKLAIVALAGALWVAVAILDFIDKDFITNTALFVMHLICAVVWIAAFLVNLQKYLKEKKNKDQTKF